MEGQSQESAANYGGASASAQTPTDRPRGSVRWFQRKRIIIPVSFLLFMGAIVFFYWYTYLRGYVSTDDAYVDGYRSAISSKILGRIIELKADEGDTVLQGELLVIIDDKDLRADEAQAVTNIAYIKESAAVAKVNLARTLDDFERAKTQYADSVISDQEYDHAQKAYELAKNQYDMALASIKLAEAELSVIQTDLTYTLIYSPSDGVIAKRWVLAGDVVAPGQPIFTAFNLENVWVTANFEETKISSIRIGDPVHISVDAYANDDFSGEVLFVGAATASQFSLIPPNNASGNFTKVTQRVPVRISIKSQSQSQLSPVTLVPGMSVVVRIDLREE